MQLAFLCNSSHPGPVDVSSVHWILMGQSGALNPACSDHMGALFYQAVWILQNQAHGLCDVHTEWVQVIENSPGVLLLRHLIHSTTLAFSIIAVYSNIFLCKSNELLDFQLLKRFTSKIRQQAFENLGVKNRKKSKWAKIQNVNKLCNFLDDTK